jgi:hypothetical protein
MCLGLYISAVEYPFRLVFVYSIKEEKSRSGVEEKNFSVFNLCKKEKECRLV